MERAILIDNKEDLIANLNKIEDYLVNGSDEEVQEVHGYIQKGRTFVCYKVNDEYHFAPSRFIGYKYNNLKKHAQFRNDHEVSGIDTDKKLSKSNLLGKYSTNPKLETLYIKFCKSINVRVLNYKRKYWLIDWDLQPLLQSTYVEGMMNLRTHMTRERNTKLVRDAKLAFKRSHGGHLFCEVCGFDFYRTYGKLGEGFIEAHHRAALSESEDVHLVKITDLAMVCPNCHSMLHRDISNLTIESLKIILSKNRE